LKIRWPRWVMQLARKTGIVPAQVAGQKGLGSRTARQTIEGRARPRPNGTIIGYVFDREIIFDSGDPPNFKPDDTIMLRTGFSF